MPQSTRELKNTTSQGPSQAQKLDNVDSDLIAMQTWIMDFMKSLVEVATKKVQPIVIRHVIAGRLTHKDTNKCMQLQLHASFHKIKLLTRGFFEVTVNEKHKDFEPRKLTMVEYKDYTFQMGIPIQPKCTKSKARTLIHF
jgi:hypothetical protein